MNEKIVRINVRSIEFGHVIWPISFYLYFIKIPSRIIFEVGDDYEGSIQRCDYLLSRKHFLEFKDSVEECLKRAEPTIIEEDKDKFRNFNEYIKRIFEFIDKKQEEYEKKLLSDLINGI